MSNVHPPGMCKDCRVNPCETKPDGTIATRCRGCADTRNAEAKAAREERKRRGLCAYAGGCTEHAESGRVMCPAHLRRFRKQPGPNYPVTVRVNRWLDWEIQAPTAQAALELAEARAATDLDPGEYELVAYLHPYEGGTATTTVEVPE